ncbi:hypothetical protein ACHAXR_007005 [Thalassiosira sp. AJA248-18]
MDNHYETLGISKEASQEEIKNAYKELALKLHPDKCKFGANLMKKVNAAKAVLSDEAARRQYDNSLSAGRSTPGQQQSRPRQQSHYSSPPRQNSSGGGGGSKPWSNRSGSGFNFNSSSYTGGGYAGNGGSSWRYGTNSSSYNSNKENNPKEKEDTHKRFLCIICNDIVTKDFWDTSCCRKLCCSYCLGIDVPPPHARDRNICPNFACQKPMNVRAGTLIDGWTRGSKAILAKLEEVAPTHECGRNVLPRTLNTHLLVCPALNTACFKCSGTGKVKSGYSYGFSVQCIACAGKKYLRGEWSKCFVCSGTGCNGCGGKGAIKGIWSMCYRCAGKGSVTEQKEPGTVFSYKATPRIDGNTMVVFHSITAMPRYENMSYEELRLEDYMAMKAPFRSPGKSKSCCVGCTVCESKGRLEGKWTVCFCCEGSGSRRNEDLKVYCNACSGKGVVWGYNLQPCVLCMGGGCETCNWRGSEKCNCGPSCKGHESDL